MEIHRCAPENQFLYLDPQNVPDVSPGVMVCIVRARGSPRVLCLRRALVIEGSPDIEDGEELLLSYHFSSGLMSLGDLNIPIMKA